MVTARAQRHPGTRQASSDDALARAIEVAEAALGRAGWRARELHSSRTVRTFLLHAPRHPGCLLRFALEPDALEHEAQALSQLEEARIGLTPWPIDPEVAAAPWPVALFVGRGRITAPRFSGSLLEASAKLLASLHGQPSLVLMRCFPTQEKPSILSVFQKIVEVQRTYLLYREQDGLPRDMLALTLADIGRVMRQFVVAQEHYFLPHPRRSLCHGNPDPSYLVRDRGGLHLYGFERARVGDAARDVALFSVAAQLGELEEVDFLETYLDAYGREDHRFIHRYVAHRVLALFERPVARLLGLYRIKYDGAPVFGDVVTVLLEEVATATRELAVALTTLNDFLGRGRPLAPRDVASMGRLVAHEEYLLRDKGLVIAIEGPSFSGKTPVATELAARLEARYVNIGGLLRAGISLSGQVPSEACVDDAVSALQAHEVVLELCAKEHRYAILADGEDITALTRTLPLYQAQRRLLSNDDQRGRLASVVERYAHGSAVVEGERLDAVVPPTARRFSLRCDERVRQHRWEQYAEGEEASVLRPEPAAAPVGGDGEIETSQVPAAQVALDIIQRCLPEDVRAQILVPDFTGRRPLFER